MEDKKFIDIKEEDCIFYIYPLIQKTLGNNDMLLSELGGRLESIRSEIEVLSQDYIWHNESPHLGISHLSGDDPLCFKGKMNYGENIEDEWFLLYILRSLTLMFDDLLIRVFDSDGEFILIEAAEHLPSWVTPESSEGRVFLYRGHIHILPKDFKPLSDDEEEFTVSEDVLEFIRANPKKSITSTDVEAAIKQRISAFPSKIQDLMHETVAYLPVAVAALLDIKPALVTSAVRAFCDRDLVDVRACKAMKYFPPENRVYAKVRFTKCAYSMLASSKYIPDKTIGWNLPATSDESYKAHIIGIKLACGFEILLSQSKRRNSQEDNIEDHSEFHKFKNRLNQLNYFRGLLEHSIEYNQLLDAAKDFYRKNLDLDGKKFEESGGTLIGKLMDELEFDAEDLARRGLQLGVVAADDSWLNVTRDDLDAMLSARFGLNPETVDGTSDKPQEIAKHLNKFISQVSGLEGAQFPSATSSSPTRPARKKKKKNVQFTADTKLHSVTSSDQIASKSEGEPGVTIEPDGFVKALQNILDFSIPDDNYWESDGSGMSSYEDEDEMDFKPSNKSDLMKTYFEQMDSELASTTMGKSFIKKNESKQSESSPNDAEDLEPVDIDMNALKNIIMSYRSQMGQPGPAENILGPMGINLDDIDADVD